jgi:hypothetical protein
MFLAGTLMLLVLSLIAAFLLGSGLLRPRPARTLPRPDLLQR